MADENYNAEEAAELKKKRAFRKFSYRGVDLDQLLDLSSEQLRDVVHARARRRFNRGLKRKPMGLIKKLRKSKQEAKPNEKPDLVKTHLRNMIIVPEMIGSVIGVYSGKEFNQVEVKPEMVGHYLGEFSISYKPVKHGRPGIGATHSSRFIPLNVDSTALWTQQEPPQLTSTHSRVFLHVSWYQDPAVNESRFLTRRVTPIASKASYLAKVNPFINNTLSFTFTFTITTAALVIMSSSFPQFSDGDVNIRLSSSDKDVFKVHSFVLALHSSFFKASLSDRWSAKTPSVGGKAEWSYELRFTEDRDGILVRQDSCSNTTDSLLYSKDEDDPVMRAGVAAHRQLLGVFYHNKPSLPTSSYVAAEPAIEQLLATADMYDCSRVVLPYIEGHLSTFINELLAIDYFTMLGLAVKFRCGWLFKEALCHNLGRSDRTFWGQKELYKSLGIGRLVLRKRDDFVAKLKNVERSLLAIAKPQTAMTPMPQDDACQALAVAYFRDWLLRKIGKGEGSGLRPFYFKVYGRITLRSVSNAERVNAFIEKMQLTPDGVPDEVSARVMDYLNEIIDEAATILEPIMDIQLLRKLPRPAGSSLVFMEIKDDELPWSEDKNTPK
ncbi:hypothetical protein B0A49_04666 [Cryomyces minteri]|uniref:BTB domain-containing protein n=2 Tax=Cryomyces TaxID=329878 RepID=A0A4V5NEL1_9PEZI|nr:hypothetical protein B0A49_04666 [Cryomyces minteri]